MAIEDRHPARARKHLTELVWGWAAHCSVSYRRHGGPGHISPSCQWRTPHAGQRLPYVILDICDADSAMSEEIALRAKFVLRRQRGAIGYYVRLEIEPREARSAWITVWRYRGGSRKVASSRVPREKILHEDGSVAEGGLAMILHELFWAGSQGHYRTDEVVALGDAVMKERVFLGYNEIADMVAEAREDMLDTREWHRQGRPGLDE